MNTLKDIGQWLGMVLGAGPYSMPITELATDSRKVQQPASALFFAISDERHDHWHFCANHYFHSSTHTDRSPDVFENL